MPQSWDMGQILFYFPSGGRHAEDFYARKNPMASAGFEPANLFFYSYFGTMLCCIKLKCIGLRGNS